MVKLQVSNGDQVLAARQESTRSGAGMVPVAVRNAGPRAVESFLCFFARASSKYSGYVYRTAANHFFCWCDETGLAMDTLKGGHVVSFFEAKRDKWKMSSAATYFQSLKLLFKHLEDDRIIERSPFAGLSAPRQHCPDLPPRTLEALKGFLQDLDGIKEGSRSFRPGLVAMYPIIIGGMDPTEIASVTGISLAEVETYAGRLRENGIWTPDGKIAVDFEDPESDEAVLNMVLIVGCAAGTFQRFTGPEAA
jgi:hypothetical protein